MGPQNTARSADPQVRRVASGNHRRDIVVIGASAGGVEALMQITAKLPDRLSAAIFVVLHLHPEVPSLLPRILSRAGPLSATHPTDGESIRYGRIYVAPPDHHLLVEPGIVKLSRGPTENTFRPAIDPLFRSAAVAYRSRVIGVILTGSLDDGTAGLRAVKEMGGVAIVQDPDDAVYPSMPQSASEFVDVDHIVPVSDVPDLLVRLVDSRERGDMADEGKDENLEVFEIEVEAVEAETPPPQPHLGRVSTLTCPDCNGTLWELDEEGLLRYRCRVGHAYTQESMLFSQDASVERALWAAARALEERASLMRRLADRARMRNHERLTMQYESRANAALENANTIRSMRILPTSEGSRVETNPDPEPADVSDD
jgi:two-component system chemotaxis response regulator CheB